MAKDFYGNYGFDNFFDDIGSDSQGNHGTPGVEGVEGILQKEDTTPEPIEMNRLRNFAAEMVLLGLLAGTGKGFYKTDELDAMCEKAYEIADSAALKRMTAESAPEQHRSRFS